MTTRKFYPFAPDKPLHNNIQVPVTHILITPQGRRLQVNAPQEVIALYKQRPGWTVEEVTK